MRTDEGLITVAVPLTLIERSLIRQIIRGYVMSAPLTDQDHRALLAIHEKLWTTPTEARLAALDEVMAA